MSREPIKEYLNRVEELELKLTEKDKDTLQWLVFGFNECAKLLNQAEAENQQLKEEINKISKKELKVRDMLYSIENGTLTRERLIQIEEVLFEIKESDVNE